MNSIYDETYMGGYRTPFNTILERGVRKGSTTVETISIVFNDVKRVKKDKLAKGSQTTREDKKNRKDLYIDYMNPIYDETYMGDIEHPLTQS